MSATPISGRGAGAIGATDEAGAASVGVRGVASSVAPRAVSQIVEVSGIGTKQVGYPGQCRRATYCRPMGPIPARVAGPDYRYWVFEEHSSDEGECLDPDTVRDQKNQLPFSYSDAGLA